MNQSENLGHRPKGGKVRISDKELAVLLTEVGGGAMHGKTADKVTLDLRDARNRIRELENLLASRGVKS